MAENCVHAIIQTLSAMFPAISENSVDAASLPLANFELEMRATFSPNPAPAWRPRGELAPDASPAHPSSLASQFFASPDWRRLRASIMSALEPYPDARQSLARALQESNALEKPSA